MSSVDLRCERCAARVSLYRMCGTRQAYCGPCFVLAHPPESGQARRVRRSRTPGPAGAGCARRLHLAAGTANVHRFIGAGRR